MFFTAYHNDAVSFRLQVSFCLTKVHLILRSILCPTIKVDIFNISYPNLQNNPLHNSVF